MSNLTGAMAAVLLAGIIWGIGGALLGHPIIMYGGFAAATVAFIAFTALADGADSPDDRMGWEDE